MPARIRLYYILVIAFSLLTFLTWAFFPAIQHAFASHGNGIIKIRLKNTTDGNQSEPGSNGSLSLYYTKTGNHVKTELTDSTGLADFGWVHAASNPNDSQDRYEALALVDGSWGVEYWGDIQGMKVFISTSKTYNLIRHEPVVKSVRFKNVTENRFINTGETIKKYSEIKPFVTIKNYSPEPNNVKAKIRIDKNSLTPYDFEISSGSINFSAGSTKEIELPSFIVKKSGHYSQSAAAFIDDDDLTDGADWSGAFRADNHPPTEPILDVPFDGATNLSPYPTFRYGSTDLDGDPITYDFCYGTSSPPTTCLTTDQTIWTIGHLNHDTTYYWQVSAIDNEGAKTKSPIRRFTIGPNEAPTTTLSVPNSPLEGNATLSATFRDDEGGSPKKVEWYVDSALVSTDNNPGTSPSYILNTNNYPNGNYTLKVKVFDNDGASGESSRGVTINNAKINLSDLTITPVNREVQQNQTTNFQGTVALDTNRSGVLQIELFSEGNKIYANAWHQESSGGSYTFDLNVPASQTDIVNTYSLGARAIFRKGATTGPLGISQNTDVIVEKLNAATLKVNEIPLEILETKLTDWQGNGNFPEIIEDKIDQRAIMVKTNKPAVVSWQGRIFEPAENMANVYRYIPSFQDFDWPTNDNSFTKQVNISATVAGSSVQRNIDIVTKSMPDIDRSIEVAKGLRGVPRIANLPTNLPPLEVMDKFLNRITTLGPIRDNVLALKHDEFFGFLIEHNSEQYYGYVRRPKPRLGSSNVPIEFWFEVPNSDNHFSVIDDIEPRGQAHGNRPGNWYELDEVARNEWYRTRYKSPALGSYRLKSSVFQTTGEGKMMMLVFDQSQKTGVIVELADGVASDWQQAVDVRLPKLARGLMKRSYFGSPLAIHIPESLKSKIGVFNNVFKDGKWLNRINQAGGVIYVAAHAYEAGEIALSAQKSDYEKVTSVAEIAGRGAIGWVVCAEGAKLGGAGGFVLGGPFGAAAGGVVGCVILTTASNEVITAVLNDPNFVIEQAKQANLGLQLVEVSWNMIALQFNNILNSMSIASQDDNKIVYNLTLINGTTIPITKFKALDRFGPVALDETIQANFVNPTQSMRYIADGDTRIFEAQPDVWFSVSPSSDQRSIITKRVNSPSGQIKNGVIEKNLITIGNNQIKQVPTFFDSPINKQENYSLRIDRSNLPESIRTQLGGTSFNVGPYGSFITNLTITTDPSVSSQNRLFNIIATQENPGDSFSTTVNLSIDTTPPAAPTVNPYQNPTNQERLTVTGVKEVNSSLIKNGEEIMPVGTETTWSAELPLNIGNNTFTFTSKDAAGNTSSPTEITIIRSPPIDAPVISEIIYQRAQEPNVKGSRLKAILRGRKTAGSGIIINDQIIIQPNNDLTWQATVDPWICPDPCDRSELVFRQRLIWNTFDVKSFISNFTSQATSVNFRSISEEFILSAQPPGGRFLEKAIVNLQAKSKISVEARFLGEFVIQVLIPPTEVEFPINEIFFTADGSQPDISSSRTEQSITIFASLPLTFGGYKTLDNNIASKREDYIIVPKPLKPSIDNIEYSILSQPTERNTRLVARISGTKPVGTGIKINDQVISNPDNQTTWQAEVFPWICQNGSVCAQQYEPFINKRFNIVAYTVELQSDPMAIDYFRIQETVSLSANPGGGIFTDPVNVVLNASSSIALGYDISTFPITQRDLNLTFNNLLIHYTSDGTTPTLQSNRYSQPINLKKPTTLKFAAQAATSLLSQVAAETYNVRLAKPTIDSVSYAAAQNTGSLGTRLQAIISGTKPAGSGISLNGQPVVAPNNDTLWSFAIKPYICSGLCLQITEPFTGKDFSFISFNADTESLASELHFAKIEESITLTASPSSGSFVDRVQVNLAAISQLNIKYTIDEPIDLCLLPPISSVCHSDTPSFNQLPIYFTLDESSPTTGSPIFNAPIEFDRTTTVKFAASGLLAPLSQVATQQYEVLIPKPQITRTELTGIIIAINGNKSAGELLVNDQPLNGFENQTSFNLTKTIAQGDRLELVVARGNQRSLAAVITVSEVTEQPALNARVSYSQGGRRSEVELSAQSDINAQLEIDGNEHPVRSLNQALSPIYYTLDGSEPTEQSTQYSQSIEIRRPTMIKYSAKLRSGGLTPVTTETVTIAPPTKPVVTDTQLNLTNSSRNQVDLTITGTKPLGRLRLGNQDLAQFDEQTNFIHRIAEIRQGDQFEFTIADEGQISDATIITVNQINEQINLSNQPTVLQHNEPINVSLIASQRLSITLELDGSQQTLTQDNVPLSPIYYTLDGSEPTEQSTQYSQPISVGQTTTFNFRVLLVSGQLSEIKTVRFEIIPPPPPQVTFELQAGWNMVALPSELPISSLGSNALVWTWRNDLRTYERISERLMPGVGYWVRLEAPLTLTLTPTQQELPGLNLATGVAMVDGRYLSDLSRLRISYNNRDYTVAEAITQELILNKTARWNPVNGSYDIMPLDQISNPAQLSAWWIKVNQNVVIKLIDSNSPPPPPLQRVLLNRVLPGTTDGLPPDISEL